MKVRLDAELAVIVAVFPPTVTVAPVKSEPVTVTESPILLINWVGTVTLLVTELS